MSDSRQNKNIDKTNIPGNTILYEPYLAMEGVTLKGISGIEVKNLFKRRKGMMKRLLVVLAAVVSFSMVGSLGFAAPLDTPGNYGAAGCGLGSMVFGNQPGPVQIFAATTNGTFGTQTFGITTGTSNCTKQPKFAGKERLNEFVLANMDNLAKDVAMGHGESLDTLAELLGVSADKKQLVYAKLQASFSNIFTSEKVEVADVVDAIVAVING